MTLVGEVALRRLRLRAQSLSGTRTGDVVGAVSGVCGVQAQAAGPARLAVRARTRGLAVSDVDAASVQGRVVRTWAMRGTLHMLAAADLPWLVALLGPVFVSAGRRRRAQLGLDEDTCERALPVIDTVLGASAPLTRAQLVERLVDHGVRIQQTGQAPAHLVLYAAGRGLICRGPELERDEPTYVLTAQWLGPHAANPYSDRDDALAELARRYVSGYGPVDVPDFVRWSGLSGADGKRAFGLAGSGLTEVGTDHGRAFVAEGTELEPGERPAPRLLGHFDTLLLGYRDRDWLLDPVHARHVQAGGGFIQPTVLVDGVVVGTWKLDRSRRRSVLTVEPFGDFPKGCGDGLRAEADDIGRFLGDDVDLRGL